ncbi:DsbA family protein [Kitasatospora camelliae]|uniref:Thioredoxin domain-containing protein n=1 Tax=Kitasatospora camelliae TaxID=3156397 RepID=A0AAU8K5H3_9ACTN
MTIQQNQTQPTHRNQQQPRPTARQRLQEAQRREARAAAVRRRVVIALASLGVAAVVAGSVAIAIATAEDGDSSPSTAAPLVVPANATGPDGTVVVYGRPDAPHTLKVYEDFRCPVCERFETSTGKAVQQLADDGTYKIEYHLAAFLDTNLGGQGSHTALAAMGAALNEGTDKFKQFHDVLYANQPEERVDGFGDVNRILELAAQVPGLRTEGFTKAVTEGTYRPWADKVAKAFNASGVRGTPTVTLDDKPLTIFGKDGAPLAADQFTALVRQTTGG